MIENFAAYFSLVYVNFWETSRSVLIDFLISFIGLVFGFLEGAAKLLPKMPDLPQIPAVPELFTTVNYYVPITETFRLLAFLLACYGVRVAINAARFYRGG